MRYLWLVMIGATLLAAGAVAVACEDEEPHAQEAPSASATATETRPPGITVTPTPDALGGVGDVDQALADLQRTAPEAAKVILAWTSGDFDTYLASLPSETGPCDQFVTRQGSRCAEFGVAPGTEVTVYDRNSETVPNLSNQAAVEAEFQHLTEGGSPRVAMIARRNDEAVTAMLMIEPRKRLWFPGRLEMGAHAMSIYMTVGADGRTLNLSTGIRTSPPLEGLRESARRGHPYTVLGASEEFHAWVEEQHDSWEALRKDVPTVTP